MHCDKVQHLIDGYLDGQLDLERNLEILNNDLGTCAAWRTARQNAGGTAIGDKGRSSLLSGTARTREERSSDDTQTDANHVYAGCAVTAMGWDRGGCGIAAVWRRATHELVQSVARATDRTGDRDHPHIRSLMANHLSDVVSTDQHTVKPWFDETRFRAAGCEPGTGGIPNWYRRPSRLCRWPPVAALVYKQRLHYINLFVWPATARQNERVAAEVRGGYNLVHWTQGGMTFWAVSDLALDELRIFVALLGKT